jgi:hypothetical protein
MGSKDFSSNIALLVNCLGRLGLAIALTAIIAWKNSTTIVLGYPIA